MVTLKAGAHTSPVEVQVTCMVTSFGAACPHAPDAMAIDDRSRIAAPTTPAIRHTRALTVAPPAVLASGCQIALEIRRQRFARPPRVPRVSTGGTYSARQTSR